MTKLTMRGLAMSTVAYITALTIGIFSVVLLNSSASGLSSAIAQEVTVQPAQPVDPLARFADMKEITGEDLKELLSLVGFKGKSLKIAWSVVMRESRGHPMSHNTNAHSGDNSYGLFQINMLGSLGETRRDKFGITSNSELLDPVVNAKAAYYMTNQGIDWASWGLGPNAYDGSSAEPAVTVWFAEYPSSKS